MLGVTLPAMTDRTDDATTSTDSANEPSGQGAATIYEETSDQPIAGGRWHVQADGTVLYERRPGSGELTPAIIDAEDLRTKPTWRVVGT